MKVTTVSASVRFSKALGDGQHKTVELGAEAKLEPGETMEEVIAKLYTDLGHELKSLWGNGNCNGNGNGHKAEAAAEPQPAQSLEHWCPAHETEFRKHEGKGGAVWYSHRVGETGWCREKKVMI